MMKNVGKSMKNTCFRPENDFSSMDFSENRLGDGEQYAGSYGSALSSTKIWFSVFLGGNL